MNKYRIAIWEEVSGFIELDAESKEKAEELAQELMEDFGCEKLFYPYICRDKGEKIELIKYNGHHSHGNREVLTCEEIND